MNNIKQVKRILTEFQDNLAIIVGNGINHKFNKDVFSWNQLLLELWNNFSKENLDCVPKGISFPEFMDVLELASWQKHKKVSENIYKIQKAIQSKLFDLEPNNEFRYFLNRIKKNNYPLLTTNYDDLIQKSLSLNFYKMTTKGFTDFYPWACYYSDQKLSNPLEGFGVWHINGMIKYFRSIKISLTQYMGNVYRARTFIHGSSDSTIYSEKNQNSWRGKDSWLHIVFNKSILIFGLSLDENESFLRWLLIERARYFKHFPNRKHSGFFITTEQDPTNSKGRSFFLRNVGIKEISLPTFNTLYEDIWD